MKCPVCGEMIQNPDPMVLFFSEERNADVCCCDECEKQMNELMNTEKPATLKKAINYFYTCMKENDDKEIKSYLQQVIDNNAADVGNMDAVQSKKKPVTERQKDYFAEKNEPKDSGSFWLSSTRFFAYLGMIAIIIMGIVLSVPAFESDDAGMGILIIIVSIVAAFAVVGGFMVFLDMAENVKDIRDRLSKK